MQQRIIEQLASVGLAQSAATAAALAEFLGLLSKWNRVHNLTAMTDPEEMVRRHLVESLALGSLLKGARVADVGSGAGLPGIPLAITEPQRRFTLIESRGKRAAFLRHVRGALGLENVAVEQTRVENLPGIPPFDTVLARAVAPLPALLEFTGHLLTGNTVLLALTGESFAGDTATFPGGYTARRVAGPIASLFAGALFIVDKQED
ncbi:MAG: 16S rRNA (guanine(527)-N(7))-methyltransferase RsmG [Rhodospirillaceae bacterium]|nr:16S rRNA (guanine(527)-N(7))-methyltransferase RsmG [Rhodospirillaceae bacterium]